MKAKLIVVIDTEEEFDWSKEFARTHTTVNAMQHITRGQRLFDRFAIKPMYVVDYPVATQECGYRPLQEIHDSSRCEIGLHLHPWVTPPFEESLTRRNSFAGNLSADIERSKITTTRAAIEAAFGNQATVYKAGRYGVGPNTGEILEQLGFEVDLSVCPLMDFSSEDGPEFIHSSPVPYWFGEKHRLLELPLTNGFTGLMKKWGISLHASLSTRILSPVRAVGIAARLGVLNRVCLSPEGYTLRELTSITKTLFRDGVRIFTFSFHSPSLDIGKTPYVRTAKELEAFLSKCQAYFEYFMGELGGLCITPLELKKQLFKYGNRLARD